MLDQLWLLKLLLIFDRMFQCQQSTVSDIVGHSTDFMYLIRWGNKNIKMIPTNSSECE
jgi:hypothetical protein